jgi:hypothetical protein
MDFDRWLAEALARLGEFTMLTVLVEIGETKVTPVRSTFLNVIGDEITWSELTALFASAGAAWDGASFFPVTNDDGGPLDNVNARLRLRELEARLADDRLVLNEGQFFDKWGRRLKIEEVAIQ